MGSVGSTVLASQIAMNHHSIDMLMGNRMMSGFNPHSHMNQMMGDMNGMSYMSGMGGMEVMGDMKVMGDISGMDGMSDIGGMGDMGGIDGF